MNTLADTFFKKAHFPLPPLMVVLILLVSSICLLPSSTLAASRDVDTHFFHDSFGDLQAELETAREEGKQGVLIFFELDDCPFCHRMKTTVFNKPEVQDYFRQHFQIIPIDIEGDLEMTDFQGNTTTQKDFAFKQHRVRATPVMAFFDLDGNKVATYTGATRDAKEFMLLGKFVAEGHYKTKRFTQFKREQRKK